MTTQKSCQWVGSVSCHMTQAHLGGHLKRATAQHTARWTPAHQLGLVRPVGHLPSCTPALIGARWPELISSSCSEVRKESIDFAICIGFGNITVTQVQDLLLFG